MRRPAGETRDRALAAFDANPIATSGELALRLGLEPEYVRATLRRNGRVLARARGPRKPKTAAAQPQLSTVE